jgi:hypothetical protein
MPVPAPLPPVPKALPSTLPLAPLAFFEYLNPEQTRARWCGFELGMWDGKYIQLLEGPMVAADKSIRSCDQVFAGFVPVVGMVSALVEFTLRWWSVLSRKSPSILSLEPMGS